MKFKATRYKKKMPRKVHYYSLLPARAPGGILIRVRIWVSFLHTVTSLVNYQSNLL